LHLKAKPGYKIVKSLFGKYEEIPQDWEHTTMGDHISILVGYPFPSDKYSENPKDTKLLRGDNITEGRIRWGNKTRFWNDIDSFGKYELKERDFVIGMDGSKVGKNYAYVTRVDLPCLLLQRVACLRTKPSLVQEYLRYVFGNKKFVNYVNSIRTNAAIPHISTKDIQNLELFRPSISEQQKITSILSNVDSLINQTQKNIEQTQKLKQGLMQKLLTKGIGHTKFKKVNFGGQINVQIPEEWDIATIEEISVDGTQNGLAISISDYGRGIPIVGMTKFYASEILSLDNMKEVSVGEKNKENFSLRPFDLLFGRRSMDGKPTGGAGKCVIVPELKEAVVFESSIIRMSVNKGINPFFIYQLFKSQFGKHLMFRIIRVSAVSGISSGDLKKIKVPIPPKHEQDKIVKILSSFDSQILEFVNNKSNLESLKKGLMQKLLTGKIRVYVSN